MVALIPIGYPDEEPNAPKRKPVEELLPFLLTPGPIPHTLCSRAGARISGACSFSFSHGLLSALPRRGIRASLER